MAVGVKTMSHFSASPLKLSAFGLLLGQSIQWYNILYSAERTGIVMIEAADNNPALNGLEHLRLTFQRRTSFRRCVRVRNGLSTFTLDITDPITG